MGLGSPLFRILVPIAVKWVCEFPYSLLLLQQDINTAVSAPWLLSSKSLALIAAIKSYYLPKQPLMAVLVLIDDVIVLTM